MLLLTPFFTFSPVVVPPVDENGDASLYIALQGFAAPFPLSPTAIAIQGFIQVEEQLQVVRPIYFVDTELRYFDAVVEDRAAVADVCSDYYQVDNYLGMFSVPEEVRNYIAALSVRDFKVLAVDGLLILDAEHRDAVAAQEIRDISVEVVTRTAEVAQTDQYFSVQSPA